MSKITRLTRLAQMQGVETPVDTGPRERWQHDQRRILSRDEDGRVTAWAARRGSLDQMYDARAIGLPQWRAGRAFMQAWQDAALPANRLTQSYTPRSGDRGSGQRATESNRNDWQERRYEEWRGAVRCVGKTDISLLIRVICEDGTPNSAEELTQLTTALARLAHHYKSG